MLEYCRQWDKGSLNVTNGSGSLVFFVQVASAFQRQQRFRPFRRFYFKCCGTQANAPHPDWMAHKVLFWPFLLATDHALEILLHECMKGLFPSQFQGIQQKVTDLFLQSEQGNPICAKMTLAWRLGGASSTGRPVRGGRHCEPQS